MKSQENQGFTSFDFITMLFSFGVIAAVCIPILKSNLEVDAGVEAARVQASALGQTLISSQLLNGMTANGGSSEAARAVASVEQGQNLPQMDLTDVREHLQKGEWEGKIGKDPWGNPFHFAFLRNGQGTPTRVAVWSDGPKKHAEPLVHQMIVRGEQPQFTSEEPGAIVSIR